MYNLLSEKKFIATFTVVALAFIMVMGPSSMAFNAFATSDNELEQEIEQSQYAKQLSLCVSGDGTLFSCNNLAFQDQDNDGDNTAGQSSDDGGDNDAEQSIEQEQELKQSALCVSGGGTFLSCNNIGIQDQDNDGDNTLGQSSSGYYGGDNSAEQSIEQEQELEQNSFVVSGDDSTFSGNNIGIQDQDNDGDNTLGQSSSGDNGGGDNSAEQSIEQEQESDQDSFVVSGDDSEGSGNNISVQDQDNDGDNTAGQSSGGNDDDDGDNDSEQSIEQEQESDQDSTVVSGDDSEGSGNNISVQDQDNDGDNTAGQDN